MSRRAVFLAVVSTAAVPFALLPGSAQAARSCGQVDVVFEPEGEGSGARIKATGLSCTSARRVVRRCLNGKPDGWRVRTTNTGRTVMRKGSRTVSYLGTGGGGCTAG